MKSYHCLHVAATVTGLLLLGLLSSCGNTAEHHPPATTLLSISTLWEDFGAPFEACEETGQTFITQLYLDNIEGENQFSGSATLRLPGDRGVHAAFTGTIDTSGTVTGLLALAEGESATFYAAHYEVNLVLNGTTLEGTIENRDDAKCKGDNKLLSAKVALEAWSIDPANGRNLVGDALEPNNSPEEATSISSDYEASLSLRRGDTDYFEFTLPKARLVTIEIEADSSHYFDVRATFYHENGDFQRVRTFNDFRDVSSKDTLLLAGTYHLQLQGHVEARSHTYRLRLTSSALPDSAFEPNDTPSTATKFDLNAEAKDILLASHDDDWFTFTLAKAQNVTFDVGKTTYDSDLNAILFDSDMKVQHAVYTAGWDASPQTFTLKPGTYHLRMYGDFLYPEVYAFRIRSAPLADSLLESNDTKEEATPIASTFAGTMHIGTGDEDWFVFSLGEAHIFNCTFEEFSAEYYFKVALYQGKTQRDDTNCYNDYEFVLEAGTHYLRVYGYEDYIHTQKGNNYTFNISSRPLPDKQYEPNNSLEEAYEIPLNTQLTNLLVVDNDNDWFSFTLEGEIQVQVTAEELRGDLRVYLRDENGASLGSIDYRGSLTRLLPAGTYYLEIPSTSPRYTTNYNLGVFE